MIASRSSSRVAQCRRSRTFFCNRAKKDSIAALSLQAPTRPIEPTSPLFLIVRTKACERNCLAATVGMDHGPDRVSPDDGIAQCRHRQRRLHPGVDGVADDPP